MSALTITSGSLFPRIKLDETADSAVPFLQAAVAYYKSLAAPSRAQDDNGSCYKAFAFREACRDLASSTSAPSLTRRQQTARPRAGMRLRQAYPTSDRRAQELPMWLHQYNWHRPHSGIDLSNAHQQTRFNGGRPLKAPQLERKSVYSIPHRITGPLYILSLSLQRQCTAYTPYRKADRSFSELAG